MMQKRRPSHVIKWCLLLVIIGPLLSACGKQNTAEEVRGTVVDSAGNPVAGVRVFTSGDGPQTVETLTDAEGRFRLARIEPGLIYVFVESTDYRFTGTRKVAGADEVVLKLIKSSEPLPSRSVALEPLTLEEQRKLAKRLLEKLWAADARCKSYYQVPLAMNWIDEELASRWAAESSTEISKCLQVEKAERIADEDLEDALSVIRQNDSQEVVSILKLAHRYLTSDPAKARRCTEELVLIARERDQPLRTGFLAEAGNLAVALGDKEAGWKLLGEAAEMAENLNTTQFRSAARSMVAQAMAPHDFQRAMKLLEPIADREELDHCRANLAVAACEKYPEQSLVILDSLENRTVHSDEAKLKIAYRLAPTHSAESIRVAESLGTKSTEEYQARNREFEAIALGWIAVKIAPHDKTLAFSLIDKSLDLLRMDHETKITPADRSGWPARAAFLAILAKRIGYPDMESVVYRVLACRPFGEKEHSARMAESQVEMAAFLGLVDREASKEILKVLESKRSNGNSRVEGSGLWIKAWLLADAEKGEKLFMEAISSIAGKPNTDAEFYDLIQAASILAAPSEQKPWHIINHADFCSPEKEY